MEELIWLCILSINFFNIHSCVYVKDCFGFKLDFGWIFDFIENCKFLVFKSFGIKNNIQVLEWGI
jgi:hypothetical protein